MYRVQRGLDEAGFGFDLAKAPTTVFFRDDDVGALTSGLRDVMSLLVDEGLPCNYEVVPAFLDRKGADFLKEIRSAHPQLVFLDQHGLRHEQQLAGERVWSEFAGNRPYDEQLKDIREGQQRLLERLGEHLDRRIFTPPCHKYDSATLRALETLGFEILSAGVKLDRLSRAYYAVGRSLGRVSFLGKRVSYHTGVIPGLRLAEFSVCIDVDEEKDATGRRIEKDAGRLWREFEFCRQRTGVVGIMLHHERYGDRVERIEALRAFVRRLKSDPDVRFSTLPDLASGSDPV